MSAGFNQATLLGNVGREPEMRMTAGGTAVLKFSLATTERYLDRNKEKKERTEWHNIVVWGKQAEALGKILNKGDRVFVVGKLSTESWEGKDGKKNYRVNIVADTVSLCSERNGGGGGREEFGRHGSEAVEKSSLPDDDDIPF